MRLDPLWSPEPDLLVVRPDKRPLLTASRLEGPAAFVIEIVAESDPGLDRREKLPRYRQAGIEEIWLVDHFKQSLLVETKGPSGYLSRSVPSGRLESHVLPRFWIDVSWCWRDELPSIVACFREILGSV